MHSPGITGTIAQLLTHSTRAITRALRAAWCTLAHSACCSAPR